MKFKMPVFSPTQGLRNLLITSSSFFLIIRLTADAPLFKLLIIYGVWTLDGFNIVRFRKKGKKKSFSGTPGMMKMGKGKKNDRGKEEDKWGHRK